MHRVHRAEVHPRSALKNIGYLQDTDLSLVYAAIDVVLQNLIKLDKRSRRRLWAAQVAFKRRGSLAVNLDQTVVYVTCIEMSGSP